MNIYKAANELDLLNFSGAGFSRKLGTFDQDLARCSIMLEAGSGSTVSLDALDITTGDLSLHFSLASTYVSGSAESTFIQAEDVLNNTVSYVVRWRADGTLSLQLNTETGDGTPVASAQKLQFNGLRNFDLIMSYDSGADETTLQLYVDSLLANSVTESGAMLYPTKISFSASDQSTAYLSQVVLADELTRNIRIKTLVPLNNGNYTDWTGDYEQIYDIDVDDSETLIASAADLNESFQVSDPTGDEHFNKVYVLHHFEDANDTSYSKNNLLRNRDAFISTDSVKFGSKALSIPDDGTSYAWIAGNPDLSLGDSDFCMEIWVNFNAIDVDAVLLGQGGLEGPLWRLRKEVDNKVSFLATDQSNTDPFPIALRSNTLLNQSGEWHAVRVGRVGDIWGLFIDGNLEDTAVWSGAVDTPNAHLYVGITPALTNQLNGYLDEFRLTIGEVRDIETYVVQTEQWPDKQLMSDTAPADWGTILGVSVNARCRRAEFGDISMLVRRNGTDLLSDLVNADTVFSGRSAFFPLDPVTGEAWVFSDLLSTEIGVESATTDPEDPEPELTPYALEVTFETGIADSSVHQHTVAASSPVPEIVVEESGSYAKNGLVFVDPSSTNYNVLDIGTNDFTISFDVYVGLASDSVGLWYFYNPELTESNIYLDVNETTGGAITFVLSGVTEYELATPASVVSLGAWHLIDVSRTSGILSISVDDTVEASSDFTDSVGLPAGGMMFGSYNLEDDPAADARYDNFIITIGAAAEAPPNPYVLELLFDNQDWTDTSDNAFPMTVEGNPVIYVANEEGHNALLPGILPSIPTQLEAYVPDTDPNYGELAIGTQDFLITIDVRTQHSLNEIFIGFVDPGSASPDPLLTIQRQDNNTVVFELHQSESVVFSLADPAENIQDYDWYRFSVARISGVIYLFKNGSMVDYGAYAGAINGTAGHLRVFTWSTYDAPVDSTGVSFDNFKIMIGAGVANEVTLPL